jgi:alkyldihydroxyacetonephosphate synthase
MPYFYPWMEEHLKMPPIVNFKPTVYELPKVYPESKLSKLQLKALDKLALKMSTLGSDRLIRAHGQESFEMDCLLKNKFERIPDGVIWPECHEDVVEILKICDRHNIVIIPYGGGTCVSRAVMCPEREIRPILSLDTCMMNEILWLDLESLVACCEGGIVGQDLERELQKRGFTCGHEPDSIEFSTLGGWVATRASGMKKNQYGNIEDIVVHARMATPRGVLEKGNRAPRMSCGPDFNHLIMGCEGCFGVVTEVCIKIRPLPSFKKFGSLVFPDFESGFGFMREVARRRLQPASIRFLDNEMFLLGRTLRDKHTILGMVIEKMTNFYLEKIKGFDFKKMTFVTLLYEGEEDDVLNQETKINTIGSKYGGIPAGQSNGRNGYSLTYSIAYIRV